MKCSHPNLDASIPGKVTSVSGRSLVTLGKLMFSFVIDSEIFPFEAHVIQDLTFDVIIGRDFLRKFSSRIDFVKSVVEFSRDENPLPFCDASDGTSVGGDSLNDFVCSVHADFSFTVPPESEFVVMGKLNLLPEEKETCGLVVPRFNLPHRYSIFGASELVKVTDDGTVPIRMVNPSAQPVKIFRRTRLADFELFANNIAIYELREPEELDISAVPCDSDERLQPQSDYSDLPDLSDSVLSDGDRIKFRNLFRKYRDVFAFSEDQLGRTSLVQHVIDTGDAMPIKQRPYRTSPEGKQEIDRQVGEMLQKGIIQESVSPWSSPLVLAKKKRWFF